MIRKKAQNVSSFSVAQNVYKSNKPPANRQKTQNLVDVLLLGTSKKYTHPPKTKEVSVPIPIPLDPNVTKAQGILNRLTARHEAQHGPQPKLISKIGQGGYGTVFRGTTASGRNVAVKFQKNAPNAHAESNALRHLYLQFIAPTRRGIVKGMAWSQNFANLVPKGLAQTNKGYILKQNFINGKPLRNYTTGSPLNKTLKNSIVKQVNKMHKLGVIHGNLHRNNIIVNKNGHPWLIDFGKSIIRNGVGWKNTKNANAFVKGHGHGFVEKYGKKFYYLNANKTRSLQANGNFLKKLK